MKKFISVLAGVAMASALFVANAYAANVSFSVTPSEVNIGDEVTVVINSDAKSISSDGFGVAFDLSAFECTRIANASGEYYETKPKVKFPMWYDDGDDKVNYTFSKLEEAAKAGKVGFGTAGSEDTDWDAAEGFATITFKAIAATDAAAFTLYENSAGADGFVGDVETINVKVIGNEPDPDPVYDFGTVGNTFRGLGSKYWTVDYAAGEFTGNDEISLTDGEKTKTINVKTAEGFDIGGAVSFYVYVLGNDIANVYIVE